MKYLTMIVLSLLLVGCANHKPVEYTTANKALMGFAIGGNVADIVSTNDALDRGCSEGNPLYGSNPSTGLMIAVKTVLIGGAYAVTEYGVEVDKRQDARNWIYGILGVIGTGAAIHNYGADCY